MDKIDFVNKIVNVLLIMNWLILKIYQTIPSILLNHRLVIILIVNLMINIMYHLILHFYLDLLKINLIVQDGVHHHKFTYILILIIISNRMESIAMANCLNGYSII